jgi:hypothetical protein
MGRYRKIDTKIWNDENFEDLSDDSKLTFLLILTHPYMTAIGAMRTTIPGLAAELGWSLKRFRVAIQPLLSKGMIELNEQACYLALPNLLRYNEPEGPNSVTKAWPQALSLIPECPEKATLITRCQTYLNGRSDAFRLAIGDAMRHAMPDGISYAKPKPYPIQEQEPEQEPEQNKETPPAVDHDFEKFWKSYPARNGKRVGKPEAQRKFEALSLQDRELAIVAARNYAASELVQKGVGVKDPHRFLQNGKQDQPWRDWITPEVFTRSHTSALTCTKRVQGDRFLRPCGQPASPHSRPTEPRCEAQLSQAQNLGASAC